GHHLAQPRERQADARLDGAERLLEPLRDLGLREAGIIRELDDFALRLRELREGAGDELSILRTHHGVAAGRRGRAGRGRHERLATPPHRAHASLLPAAMALMGSPPGVGMPAPHYQRRSGLTRHAPPPDAGLVLYERGALGGPRGDAILRP